MFSNIALDVVIGLVFIFLLYSMLATIIQEIIATKLSFRAKILQKAILRMLEDGKTTTISPFLDVFQGFYQLLLRSNTLKGKKFATAFYTHPLIKYLSEDNWFSKPGYITSQNFSKVIIDLLHGIESDVQGYSILKIKDSIDTGILKDNLKTNDPANPANRAFDANQSQSAAKYLDINPETKLFLQSLLTQSQGDIEKLKTLLEKWFDDTMDRATGWYKRYTQYILLIIGFTISFTFNVDSIAIYRILSKDKRARDQLVKMAIASNEKFKPEIDREKANASANANFSSPQNDSLLMDTYKIIIEDANKSDQIMGLGSPWKDTCEICEILYSDGVKSKYDSLTDLNVRFDTVKINVVLHDSSIKSLTKILGQQGIKASKKNNAKMQIDSLIKIRTANLDFLATNKRLLLEYDSLAFLYGRCNFIKNSIGNKWFKYNPNQKGGAETFLGWLITALAISLGAPFWFDLLNKLIRLRGSGNKSDLSDGPDKSAVSTNASRAPITLNINPNPGEEAVG